MDGVLDENTTGTNSENWTDVWRADGGQGIETFVVGGAVNTNGSRLWNDGFIGKIDELRIYDTALNAETIVRQAVGNGDSAGDFMHIHHNTFLGEDRYGFVLRGRPFIEAYVHHNWFRYSNPNLVSRQMNATGNFRVEHNHVGYEWPPNTPNHTPMGIVRPSRPFQTAPVNLAVDSLESTDAHYGIVDTLWHLGGLRWVTGPEQNLVFDQPGRILMKAQTFNRLGLYDETLTPIEIYPEKPYVLTAKVMDSYRGEMTGKYEKRILINGQTAWSDDVAGDENWQHITISIDDYIDPADPDVDIKFVLHALSDVAIDEIVEIRLTIDDVHVFGGQVGNGTMEAASGWRYDETHALWSGRFSTIDKFSGTRSYQLSHPYNKPALGGTQASLSQTVPLLSTTRILQLDFDASGLWALKDNGPYRLDVSQPADLVQHLVPDGQLGGRSVRLGPNSGPLVATGAFLRCLNEVG